MADWQQKHGVFVPQCGWRDDNNHLALTLDNDATGARPILGNIDPYRKRWTLRNKGDGQFQIHIALTHGDPWDISVVIRAPFENSPVELKSVIAINTSHGDTREQQEQGSRWRMVQQGAGPWFALQLVSNPKQNLNVGGNDPHHVGDPIYSYKWSDGASNELWQFLETSSE